jgi:hypothetical protein
MIRGSELQGKRAELKGPKVCDKVAFGECGIPHRHFLAGDFTSRSNWRTEAHANVFLRTAADLHQANDDFIRLLGFLDSQDADAAVIDA